MIYIEYAKQRYDAAIQEISRLKQSEFPYPQIKDALLQMEVVFQKQRDQLNKLKPSSTPVIAKNSCSQSLAHLFNYTPFLGFILRSTNVRNAFEVYSPVLRLARQLLGASTKLLLSSEWDYSPFVYLPTAELPNFVLIGVPSFESSNPLLMSLAGHELGHNIWDKENLGKVFDSQLQNAVLQKLKGKYWTIFESFQPNATHANLTTDMFVQPAWLPAYSYARGQLEEIFCDMMGLRLFAESYLNAFAYLLSPSVPGERYPYYPSIKTRAAFLEKAAAKMSVDCPPSYNDLFSDSPEPSSPLTKLLCAVADDAVLTLIDQATDKAMEIAATNNIPKRNEGRINEIVKCFEMVIPTDGRNELVDIINAGWKCEQDPKLWHGIPQISLERYCMI